MKKYFSLLIILSAVSISTIAQDYRNKIQVFDSLMRLNYPTGKPGASIIVMKDNKAIFSSGYGLANLETSEEITTKTVFRIGSITKQFTAISIMMLVAEDKLNLEDEVSMYYPELFADKHQVTIMHLLSHTAGIVDLSRIRAVRSLMSVHSEPEKIIEIISQQDLNFEPGEKYEYSNSGYVILGGIIEKVSGLSYSEFLQARIFAPLGMSSTYYTNASDIKEAKAVGYFTRPAGHANAPEIDTSLLFSAGGLWSTVGDLAIWNEALYGSTLLDSKYVSMAFTPNSLNNGKKTDYGFGFRSCKVNEIPSIEHGGGVFGYSSYGIRIEEHGVYVAILTNFERENNYDDVAAKMAAIASESPYENSEKNLNLERASDLVGKYLVEESDTIQVLLVANQLAVKRNSGEAQTLIPLDENAYLIQGSLDDKIVFNKTGNGVLTWKPRRAMSTEALKLND